MRLDLAVSRTFGLSRRAARDAVRAGRVDVGGQTVDEPGTDVVPETKIELHASRPARRRVRARLSVLHEDGDVIIVDKPAGLLTVPTEAREKDTLWSRVLFYLQHRYGGRPYAGIVHRIDKDTSGAVVFARNRAALHFLQERFREHAIDREYVVIAAGAVPDKGSYDADLDPGAGPPPQRGAPGRAGAQGRDALSDPGEATRREPRRGEARDGPHAPDPRALLGRRASGSRRSRLRSARRRARGPAPDAPREDARVSSPRHGAARDGGIPAARRFFRDARDASKQKPKRKPKPERENKTARRCEAPGRRKIRGISEKGA